MAMDKLFKPDEHEFISPLVNFGTFAEVARKQRDNLRRALALGPLFEFSYPADMPEPPAHVHKRIMPETEAVDDSEITAAKLREVFCMEDDDAQKIVSSLNVSHLALLNKRDIFFRKKVDLEDVPADTELETLKLKKKVLDMFYPIKKKPAGPYDDPRQRERDIKMRRSIQQSMCYGSSVLKYGDYYENEMRHCRDDGYKPSVVNDIVVTVVICKPYNKALEYTEKRNASLRPYWRFLLRGETSLLELHSLFRCTADYGSAVDEDMAPQLHDFNMFKYPSSFMFIHDTFYIANSYAGSQETLSQIDTSKIEPHIDISEPIREWMKKKKNDFGPTQVKTINDGKVKDLVCRLGYPYVYIHQGSCEHLFFFTDLRLMDVQDYPFDFPQKLSDTSLENYCDTCHKRIADWIVESESFPISPAHMCDDCYRSFHYILAYRRSTDSKAYIYMDPSILQY